MKQILTMTLIVILVGLVVMLAFVVAGASHDTAYIAGSVAGLLVCATFVFRHVLRR